MNLVTGGCGFIGTHLVRLLRERGEEVRVLDLKPPVEAVEGTEYRQGSITDREAVTDAVYGCQRVFHLAALSGLWGPDKQAFLTVNRDGTRNVIDACASASVQTVVHTSTESVLIAMGRGRSPQAVNEAVTLTLDEMAGEYCEGKLLAEQTAREAADRGQRVIVVNPTVPAGPGDHWVTPPTRMMLGFLTGRYPAYLDSCLNLVDARDVAHGHWSAATHGEPGRRYILGGHNVRMQELLSLLQEISGRPMPKLRIPYPAALTISLISEWIADHITHKPPAAPLAGVRLAGIPVRFDNNETRNALEWRPRPLPETLRDAVEDYRTRALI